jgi:hypothetical protein
MPFQKGHTINLGRKHSEEFKEKCRYPRTALHKQRISEANIRIGNVPPTRFGKENTNWHGGIGTYKCVHKWIKKHYGTPDTCEHCGKSGLKGIKIHWANVSRKYWYDRKDWLRLCTKCHGKFDKGNRASYYKTVCHDIRPKTFEN